MPDTATAVAPDERLPALDGLRGCAILLVMLHHFTREPASGLVLDRLFWRVASVGWCGVDLFFVLSGFLITGLLLDGATAGHPKRHFYLRRFLRVLPVYYVLLGAILLFQPRLLPSDTTALTHLAARQHWYWGFASNVLITRPGEWDAALPWTTHFWSLAVEEQFYLVWPLVVWFTVWITARMSMRASGPPAGGALKVAPDAPSERRHLAMLLAVCIIATLGSALARSAWLLVRGDIIAAYVLTPVRFDGFAVGALVCVCRRVPAWRQRLERLALPTALLAGTLLVILFLRVPSPQNLAPTMQRLGFPTLALFFGALLVLATRAPDGALQRLLRSYGLREAGRYSYAAYLLHFPIIFAVTTYWFRDDALPRVAGSQLHSMLLLALVAAGVTFAMAWVSWRVMEQPLLALKRHFPYGRLSGRERDTERQRGESQIAA